LEKLDDFITGKEILIEDIDGEYAISLGKNQFDEGGKVSDNEWYIMPKETPLDDYELWGKSPVIVKIKNSKGEKGVFGFFKLIGFSEKAFGNLTYWLVPFGVLRVIDEEKRIATIDFIQKKEDVWRFEHHWIPKEFWIKADEIKFDEWNFTKDQLEKYKIKDEAKTDEAINDAILKYQNSFKAGGNVDKQDTVTMDIPLLIRTLELVREDIHSDPDLHFVVENLLHIKNKKVLTMDDYAYIADIEHKHTKQYASGGNTSDGKKQVSLGFGSLGSGTTVWDRNRIQNGDYKIVAHISDSGKITYYDKNLPESAINQIEQFVNEESKLYAKGGELSEGYDFTPIQTPLN
jgi:hypothetical protein